MKVLVPHKDLVVTPSGNVTGFIYLDVNGIMFPEKNWSDFPFTLFGWWWGSLMKLNTASSAKFIFMDGDFEFILKKRSELNADITLIHADESIELETTEISLKSFRDSFLKASLQMVTVARANNWNNSDIKGLNILVNGFDSQYRF